MRTHAILVSAVALLCAACSMGALPTSAPTGVDLTLFGAASLSGVLDAAKAAFESAHPGTTLTISTDSSSTLATQIEQGAPADVFLSADTSNPQRLVAGGFAAGPPVVFAANELTIIVPAGNPASIASPADLAKDGIKVIAAGDEVPITAYATRLVGNLASRTDAPAAFEAAYAANIVSKEDNVKAVVAKIELGEGDAGIVYVTDARASTRVEIVDVPDTADVTASYAGVVVKTSAHQAAAAAFLAWFAGPDGQAILTSSGFLPPAP
jgi:molybdate transport system substrate-binding protein